MFFLTGQEGGRFGAVRGGAVRGEGGQVLLFLFLYVDRDQAYMLNKQVSLVML